MDLPDPSARERLIHVIHNLNTVIHRNPHLLKTKQQFSLRVRPVLRNISVSHTSFGSLAVETEHANPGRRTDSYILQDLPTLSSPTQIRSRTAMKNQTSNCMTASMEK
jgi:hypothetical protein